MAVAAHDQPTYPLSYPLRFARLRRSECVPTFREPESLEGSTARVAADRGQDVGFDSRTDRGHAESAGRMDRSRAAKPWQQPTSEDAIKPGTCTRCGLVANHRTVGECIDSLRSVIADLR